MPADPSTSLTKGFAFLEFADPGAAAAAVDHANGYKLDKSHTLAVNRFDDVARYAAVPDAYAPPPPREYTPSENLQAWMLDRRGRDQFAIRYGDETEVLWNDAARRGVEPAYSRSFWSDAFVMWSPRGSYLATVHRQGVAVWGGPSFERLQRYAHPGVTRVDFSPGEKFLVTYSASEPAGPRDRATVTINVFDVRTGRKLRCFTGPADEWAVGAAGGGGGGPGWPLLKWAGGCDDKYCARLARGAVSVYETPSMVLLDKKSIKLDGVVDFAWSPAAPVLCCYQVEQAGGNVPARIALVRVPDRVELRQKQLFSVSDVRLHWHPAGTYLAVEVSRFTKTRKSTYTHFELFTLSGVGAAGGAGAAPPSATSLPTVPMEVLELAKTDAVVDFAWEPAGTRFGVLHVGADGPRPAFSLYDMAPPGAVSAAGVTRVGTAPNQQATTLFWSPAGKFLVLAGLKALNGQLCFFSADEFEVLSAGEHFMATDVAWDPIGRYVATAVTSVHQMENGYKVRVWGGWEGGRGVVGGAARTHTPKTSRYHSTPHPHTPHTQVWLFNGKLLHSAPRDRFYQFLWRPRPPSLLSAEALASIKANLKKYAKAYDEEDAALLHEADAEIVAARRAAEAEWTAWKASRAAWAARVAEGRKALLGPRAEEGEYTTAQVEVEETLSVEETVLKAGEVPA